MDIQALRDRVYFIAGQLEEAKRLYEDAMKELKKQQEAETKKAEEMVGSV